MRTAVAAPLLLLFAVALGGRDAPAVSPSAETPRQRMVKALRAVLPEVEFREASLAEVVHFLSQTSRVNMVIDPAVYAYTAAVREPSPPPVPATYASQPKQNEPPAETGPHPPQEQGITLHLKNVPLGVVLKYALRYKNLRYIVEDYAIVIAPITGGMREELSTEVFRLRTGGGFEPPRPTRRQTGRPF